MKLYISMLVLFMTVYVVYSADAVIEDEDENTNPQTTKAAETVAAADADDYVPSEEEAEEIENEESDGEGEVAQEQAKRMRDLKKDIEAKNLTLNWDQKVIELKYDEFDYWIEKFDALMVQVYASWCGHCQDFVPKYNEIGQQLFDNSPRYFVAKIDGSKYPEIRKRYEVSGFPHFIFFKRGKAFEYSGDRNVRSIVEFIKKNGPETVQKLDCGMLIEQKRRQNQMVVYFGPSEADSKFLMVEGKAKIERRFSFFWNNEPECWEKHGVKARTTTFMTNFEGEGFKMHVYKNNSDLGTFSNFLIEPQIPPLIQYDLSIGETMRSTKKPSVILFRNEEDEFEDYAGVYKKAAIANRGKAIFVWVDKDDEDGVELSKHMKVVEFGLDPGGPVYPSIRIMWIYRNERFISQIDPRDHTVETITDFLDQCLAHKHEKFLPSIFHDKYINLRIIPHLSGRQFKKHLFEDYQDKDVVIYFFSPDCPHCAKYTPEYQKLAYALINHEGIKFTMMDAVNNMVDGLNIARYPMIQFWPRGRTENGNITRLAVADNERDLTKQLDWLLENSEALKEDNITAEMIHSEEHKASSEATVHQYEVKFNETIKAEQEAEEQAKIDEQKAQEEQKKAYKEHLKAEKEQKKLQKKAAEEKAKAYQKAKDEGEEIEPEEVQPSKRIPGEKKKFDPNAVPLDKDGNPMVKRDVIM